MPARRGRTYQCYDCGRTVEDTEVARRNITTYGSSGRYLRTSERRVNLCPACFTKRDVRDKRIRRAAIVVAAILLVVFYVYLAVQPGSSLLWPRF